MNQLKTVALLGLLSGLLVMAGTWIFGGSNGALLGLAIAALTNFGSWYFSDRIALTVYGAQPAGPSEAPRLHAIVERLSQRAGLPKPDVYIVPTQAANAFATGRDPQHAAVAVTQGLLQMLPEDELEGVLAHELSHVANRDTLTQAVAATIAGAIAFMANIGRWTFFFFGGSRSDENGTHPLAALLAIVVTPLAAMVIQMGISRTREFEADAGAAKLTGNPHALANALQRLENMGRKMPMQGNPAFKPLLIANPFSGEGLARLFATHPSTEERVRRLTAM